MFEIKDLVFDKKPVGLNQFKKLLFQVGTIRSVRPLAKARKPSYEMDAIFETNKKSCGQFTRNYREEELIGKQIVGLTNLPFVRIAGIKSEYLTLGFSDELNDGQAIPLIPCHPVLNGTRILLPNSKDASNEIVAQAEYQDFESVEILSATIIDIITSAKSGKSYGVVDIGEQKIGAALIIGKLIGDLKEYLEIQIPVICNLLDLQQDENFFLNFEIKLIALTIPIDSVYSTLIKVDKPVKNGINLF